MSAEMLQFPYGLEIFISCKCKSSYSWSQLGLFASVQLQMCNSMGITPAYTDPRGQSITYAEKLLQGAERPV